MWLFTPSGFFSVVQKSGTDYLTVRSRARGDLDNLRGTYLPELSETLEKAGTDYPYRATTSHAAFSVALARIARDIGYDNFKDEVYKRQGLVRAKVYGKVWTDLLALEDPVRAKPTAHRKSSSYGGVIIDDAGNVLLVEPKGHFDGYVWTLPKGHAKDGESPEDAAVREVREETGKFAVVVTAIPGLHAGGTTISQYFLMKLTPISGTPTSDEIESLRWADYTEARSLIRMSKNEIGMHRDLAVVDAAYLTWYRAKIDEQHQFESRQATNRGSWSVKPMEEPIGTIQVDQEFTDAEMDLIRRGRLPEAMEDKWFLFWEEGRLYACRSWTGRTIFSVAFANRIPGRWEIVSVDMPLNALEEAGPDYARDLLTFLIDRLLLRRSGELPQFPGSDHDAGALSAWRMVGRESLGGH